MCNQKALHKSQILLLQSARVVLGSSDRLDAVMSLTESAQQCIKAAELPDGTLSMLESWLGPSEVLAAHGTQRDMELMLVLKQYFPAGRVSPRPSFLLTLYVALWCCIQCKSVLLCPTWMGRLQCSLSDPQ